MKKVAWQLTLSPPVLLGIGSSGGRAALACRGVDCVFIEVWDVSEETSHSSAEGRPVARMEWWRGRLRCGLPGAAFSTFLGGSVGKKKRANCLKIHVYRK